MAAMQGIGKPAMLLTLAVALLAFAAPQTSASRALLQTQSPAGIASYDLHVQIGKGAPDCFQRDVILVNGVFQPTLEVTQGDILQVNVFNEIPANFPANQAGGITIHWHGFNMNGLEWLDGTGYITQCPIAAGTNFTYSFKVNEAAGTYFWHGHNTAHRANGLQGALIVRPKVETFVYDEERILFTQDLFHGEANQLAFTLGRPFYADKQTKASGKWLWVGLPQAILVNGKGYFGDCALIGGLSNAAGQATNETTCNVTTLTVPPGKSTVQPWATPSNPGCTHESISLTPGKTYRFRIINGGTLVYQTVCFGGHNVTIIQADATPTEPISFGSCVDVNVGQRYDVLLTANAAPDNYWLTVQPQFRIGSPNGYAILNYKGASNTTLPKAQLSQPGQVLPWTTAQIAQVVTSSALLGSAASNYAQAIQTFPKNATSLSVPNRTRAFVLQGTQPLLNGTGQLRWSLNNIAFEVTPKCTSLLADLYADDKDLLSKNHVLTSSPEYNGPQYAGVQEGNDTKVKVYLDGEPQPLYPSTGKHVLRIAIGDVIDIIVVNNPANAFNGDYSGAARNGTEQHPFHLHGHHFWVLGFGTGAYQGAASDATLNTVNPIWRDTFTVQRGGWTAIRFVADNPGTWLMHCHNDWHMFIGQALVFVEGDPTAVSSPPPNLPTCPAKCTYEGAPFTPSFVKATYGSTGYETPGTNADK